MDASGQHRAYHDTTSLQFAALHLYLNPKIRWDQPQLTVVLAQHLLRSLCFSISSNEGFFPHRHEETPQRVLKLRDEFLSHAAGEAAAV